MQLLLEVMMPGDPVGKGRPRFSRRGRHVQTHNPTSTDRWEEAFGLVARSQWSARPPATGPLELHVLAMKRRPKRMCTRSWPDGLLLRTTKPDGDNVGKIVADALQKASIIVDDAHISRWVIDCVYGGKGQEPATLVRLYAMDPARLEDVRLRWAHSIDHHEPKGEDRCSRKELTPTAKSRR